MNFQQDIENQVNINLILIDAKIKALKATLTDEQLKVYDKSIEDYKAVIQSQLAKVLTTEQFDALIKAFDN